MAAIEVRGVSKRFLIGKEKFDSLKDRLIHLGRTTPEVFWALKGIDLDIEHGETFGLLGHNGSGKSTLLKCIAGILQPTTGEIRTEGRLSALLELGAGFHPDLTGRENVELNGLLLGIDRAAIARRFDEILDFAGDQVANAIDRQVKFYSSGMYVRLGFAVAVSVDPEILLVDEVLAVGDEAFQRKCMNRVKQLQKQGCTIVVVTHAADVVRQICTRAAVLDHGDLISVDQPAVAVRTFREHLFATGRAAEAPEIADEPPDGTDPGEAEADADDAAGQPERPTERRTLKVRVRRVEIVHPRTPDASYVVTGDPLQVRLVIESSEAVRNLNVGLAVLSDEGRILWTTNTELQGVDVGEIDGEATVTWSFDAIPLLDGRYDLQIGLVSGEDESLIYDWIDAMPGFEVMSPTTTFGQVHLEAKVERSS